mgnify:FL=1
MKTNVNLLWVLTAFFVVATAGYVAWSWLYFGSVEPIGTAVIGFLIFLTSFIAFYLQSGIKNAGQLPEDNLDGEIEEAAGEVGFFAPWSWWPIYVSLSATVVFVSLAVDWWLFFIGLGLSIIGIIGWVYEYSRGRFAH